MKIEIEYSEIEALKAQLEQAETENMRLVKKLMELSEPELKASAVKLSRRLFDNYMRTVFMHLGFEEWERNSVNIRDNLERFIGEEWWNNDRLAIELGATVTTKFRSAFLSLGIHTGKEVKKVDDDAHKLV